MANSTRPKKPRPDFPLFIHDKKHPARARWARKVRGSFVYLGKWIDDPKGEKALELWNQQKCDLLAGRKPRAKDVDALTVESLADQFLHAKRQQVLSGELAERTWREYRALLKLVADTLGRHRAASDIRPEDWAALRVEFAKRWGPGRLRNAIVYTRMTWKWALDNGKLTKKMVYGTGFSRPPAKVARAVKNAAGPRMFEPEQLRAILDVADVNVRCMVLLMMNTAQGPTDLALLPISAIDLKTGWMSYPRRKTQIPRRVPLWSETVESIAEVLDNRPEPQKGFERLLFLDARGKGYAGTRGNQAVWRLYTAAAKAAGVTNRTPYDCRRTFLTIAERSRDAVAVSAIMGHVAAQNDMSSTYRQKIDDDRLQAVVGVVHDWLFGSGGQESDDTDDAQVAGEQARSATGTSHDTGRPRLRIVG